MGGQRMIYSRLRYYITCDKCGKTIETNAADEHIAAETAIRKGWTSELIYPTFRDMLILCPKCKEGKNEISNLRV